MTGIRLSRQAQLELEIGMDIDSERRLENGVGASATSPLLSELSGIGHVKEGSLEEAMWRELGALPGSRRGKRTP